MGKIKYKTRQVKCKDCGALTQGHSFQGSKEIYCLECVNSPIKVGQRVKVFCAFKKINGKAWQETGDIDNNQRYWFKGTVIKRYLDNEDATPLVDVKIDGDEVISKGHFESGV